MHRAVSSVHGMYRKCLDRLQEWVP